MPSDYVTRTLNAYNADPQRYEAATKNMPPQKELEEFISLVPSGASLLDAGCAFGRDTGFFASRGFTVTGVDMSSEFIKRAKELYPEIPFQVMDARSLAFPDETFAGIWCNATLLHLNDADIATALSEFDRVLAPGGALAISLKEGTGEEEIVEKFSSDHVRYFNYHTADSLQRLVEAAGLHVEKVYTVNERERYGPDARDLDWVYCFAVKS